MIQISKSNLSEKEKQDKLNKTYFKYRKDKGDYISSSILHKAMIKKYHIIYETTGYSIDWTLKTIETARKQSYIIILVYPYVTEEKLLERVSKRAKTSKDPRKPSIKRIKENIILAQRNFKKISKYVDKVFVYDNNGTPEELGIMIQLERKYKGYCEKDDKKCRYGIISKTSCDIERIEKLKRKFDKLYADYIEKMCK